MRAQMFNRQTSAAVQHGFTLIEMMVALGIGLLLTLAILITQLNLSGQNMRSSDVAFRDNEARAALGVISQDVSNSGMLFGNSTLNCNYLLNYNKNYATTPFPHYRIMAKAGGAAATLPIAVTPTISFNYPAAGSSNRSDILFLRVTPDATQLVDASNSIANTLPYPGILPLTSGSIPLTSLGTIAAGDVGLLQVPVSAGGASPTEVCFRAPISSINAASTSFAATDATYMPANFFGGFTGTVSTLTGVTLTNNLISTSSKFIDLGTAANTNQRVYVYYVADDDSASEPWPRLVRATINPLNDAQIGNPQDIAAGVVSLQVLFGLGSAAPSAGTLGSVTSYVTGAALSGTPSNIPLVRTVKILLISRAVFSDPKYSNSASTALNTATFKVFDPGNGFTAYTPSTAEQQQRFTTQIVEIPIRNMLWSNN